MVSVERVAREVRGASTDRNILLKSDFELSEGTPGQESVIAEFKAPRDLALRNDIPIRLVVPAVETFDADNSGNEETFSLSHDLASTSNTKDVVAEDQDGGRLTVVSEDDAADEVTVSTEAGTSTVSVYYTAQDPGTLRIQKQAPKSQGRVEETLFTENNKLVLARNQQEDPFHLHATSSDLERVIPEDFSLELEVDLGHQADLDVSNGILEIPAEYISEDIEGLGKAVSQDIIERA